MQQLDSVEGACWPLVQVAAGMMAGCLPAGSCAARIMLFAGGPPTIGSGKVVDMELVQPIRSAVLLGLMLLTMCHLHQHLTELLKHLLLHQLRSQRSISGGKTAQLC